MASPQLEDGYTPISNEICEALARIRISGEEWQVLWVILRKTYGWSKKMDWISISQFAKATNLGRGGVSRALTKLLQKRVILKKETLAGVTYGPQKDYDKWRPVPKKERGSNIGSRVSSKLRDTKDTLTKETLQGAVAPTEITSEEATSPLNVKPKVKRKKAPTNPDVRVFLDWWVVTYQERCKDKYHVDYPKDGALVKSLLRTFTLDELQSRATNFMDTTDEWVNSAGKTIGIFKTQVNKQPQQSKMQW